MIKANTISQDYNPDTWMTEIIVQILFHKVGNQNNKTKPS